jgi:hypothetical protein
MVDEHVEPYISLRRSEEPYRLEQSINIRSLWDPGFRFLAASLIPSVAKLCATKTSGQRLKVDQVL